MLKVTVLMFGPACDATGTDHVCLDLPDGTTVGDLSADLASRYPALQRGMDSLRFAVNEVFASADQPLADGDEVAVIPPVSGGADVVLGDLIELRESPLDLVAIQAQLAGGSDSADGGVCIFDGRTRLEQHDKHGPLVELAYEAYGSMALKQMRDLAARARQQWPIGSLALVHRIGKVPIGESSIVIAVSCGHRNEAFEACRWLIDTLKQEVPIWKKEIWQSGESSWGKCERRNAKCRMQNAE